MVAMSNPAEAREIPGGADTAGADAALTPSSTS